MKRVEIKEEDGNIRGCFTHDNIKVGDIVWNAEETKSAVVLKITHDVRGPVMNLSGGN